MQGDEIGRFENFLDRVGLLHLRRQTPGGIDRDVRVKTHDVHTELDRRVRNEAADLAQTDNTQGVLGQFEAGEMLFAVLNLLMQRLVIAGDAVNETDRRHDVA